MFKKVAALGAATLVAGTMALAGSAPAQAAPAKPAVASTWSGDKVTGTHSCRVFDVNTGVYTGNQVYLAGHYRINPATGALQITAADAYHGNYLLWDPVDIADNNAWGQFDAYYSSPGHPLNPSQRFTPSTPPTAVNYTLSTAGAFIVVTIGVVGGNLSNTHNYHASCAWTISTTGVATFGSD